MRQKLHLEGRPFVILHTERQQAVNLFSRPRINAENAVSPALWYFEGEKGSAIVIRQKGGIHHHRVIGVIDRHLELSPCQGFDLPVLAVLEGQQSHIRLLSGPVDGPVGVDIDHLLGIQFAFTIIPDIHQPDGWRGVVAFSGCIYPVTPMRLFGKNDLSVGVGKENLCLTGIILVVKRDFGTSDGVSCRPSDRHQPGMGFRQGFRQQIHVADREAEPHGVNGTSVGSEFGDIITRRQSLHPERIGKQLPVVGHIELFSVFSHAGIVHIFAHLVIEVRVEIAIMHLGHFGLTEIEGHDTQMDRFHIADIV